MKNLKFYLCVTALFAAMFVGCQENKLLLETAGGNDSRIPPDTLISVGSSETLDQWFTLTVSADGEMVYTPTKFNGYNRDNIPPQGVPVKSRISREELEEIVREFENQKFFSLKDSYEQGSGECGNRRVLDAGIRSISIEIGGRKKTVEWKACMKDGKNIPAEFFAVFNKINEIRNKNQG